MLQKLHLPHLRNGEFIQFITDVISICSKSDMEALGLKAQIDSLTECHNALISAYGKVRGSEITAELSEIDNRRDNYIDAIKTIAEAYTLHYTPEVANLAERLVEKIDTYGSRISKKNYQAETTVITNLTKGFEEDEELKLALQKTNLTEWSQKLKAENELFNQRFLARVEEAANNNEEKFGILRTDTIEAYREFHNHINAHLTLKGTEAYEIILSPLNTLIENYLLILKRRTTTSAEEKIETKTE